MDLLHAPHSFFLPTKKTKEKRKSLTDLHSFIDTTRSPRPGEVDGREYNFTTKDEFLQLVAQNGFLEHAQFGGNYYGTSVKAVRDVAEKGKVCVLDIEMEVTLCFIFRFLSPLFNLPFYPINPICPMYIFFKKKRNSPLPLTPSPPRPQGGDTNQTPSRVKIP